MIPIQRPYDFPIFGRSSSKVEIS